MLLPLGLGRHQKRNVSTLWAGPFQKVNVRTFQAMTIVQSVCKYHVRCFH